MKSKYTILASAIILSLNAFAQQNELETLKKIYETEWPSTQQLEDYKSNVAKLETLAIEENDKVYANFYKSIQPWVALSPWWAAPSSSVITVLSSPSFSSIVDGMNSILDYEKRTGIRVCTKNIEQTAAQIKSALDKKIIENKSNPYGFPVEAKMCYSIYLVDPSFKNLSWAADRAYSAGDEKTAISCYEELVRLNQKNPLQRGENLKKLIDLYIRKGRINEAKKIITDARTANPDDDNLYLAEANLYLKIKDRAAFQNVVAEVLAKNINNADLYYNLGNVSGVNMEFEASENFFLKVVQINPNRIGANYDVANAKMSRGGKITDQTQKIELYKSTIPYYEKEMELQPRTEYIAKNLIYLYKEVGMYDKAKALGSKMGLY